MVGIEWIRAAVLVGAIGVAATPTARAECDGGLPQDGLNDCALRELDAADAALNAEYRQIVARLAGAAEARQLLIKAQRAWVAFRDAECTFSESDTQGGSIHPMMDSMCRTGLTKARTKNLRRYLNCKEGDLSCPVPAQ